MNILVTGGSGRIGCYVLRDLLRAGHAASCYSRTEPWVQGVRFIKGDITKLDQLKEAFAGHDAVIHLAAATAIGRTPAEQMMYVNVMGTVHVLEAAVAADVSKVVFASSGAAFGFTFAEHKIVPRYFPLDEEHPYGPQDDYGLSKMLGELTCRRYSEGYGLKTICLSVGNNWYLDKGGADALIRRGPAYGMRFSCAEELWAEYQQRMRDPERGLPRGVDVFSEVTDVRDTAECFRLAAEDDEIVHGVFLTTGDQTHSVYETAELIERYYPDVPLKVPLAGHASLWSNAKAARALGYRPKYALHDTDFGVWLQNHPDG